MISLLLALTIAVQDTTTVQVRVPPPVIHINGDSIYINVEVGTDSLAAVLKANLEAAMGQQPVSQSRIPPELKALAWVVLGSTAGWWARGRRVNVSTEGIDIEEEDEEDHNHDHRIPPGLRKPKKHGG